MMSKNNFYKILEKENLILEFFSGIVTIDSFIGFKQNLIQDTKFSLDYNYLIHFKDVTFNINPSEIIKYIEFSNKNLRPKNQRKAAITTSTPNQVALTTLFKMGSKHRNQKVEIFSTCEKAFHWLDIEPLFLDELNFIKELQSN